MRSPLAVIAVTTAAGLAACGLIGPGAASARLMKEIPWAATGTWMSIDTHVHTRFSDGASTVAELVAQARAFGCQAVAITDHADRRLKAATPEYQAAIEAARAANPDVLILGGLEWNVPPWGGEEHATLLVPDEPGMWRTLAEFKRRFDDYDRDDGVKPDADTALRWLAAATSSPAVVIYSHPSRPDARSMENVDDILRWRAVNDLVIGFEGAPGHQGRHALLGSYKYLERPIDRWDPAAARPGDAWDTLLARGVDVHAAIAPSDFHNANPRDLNDYWPCQFAETWLRVPERTTAGVLQALRAGSFFASHGRVAREVELTVSVEGLARPAIAGEALEAPTGTTVTATVTLVVPPADWEGRPNHLDAIEFIVITPEGTSVVSRAVSGTGARAVSEPVTLTGRSLVVRARGRRVVADGPDLMFHTNAVRVVAR